MRVEKTDFDGLLILYPEVFDDSRGHFLETYKQSTFEKLGLSHALVQDSQSMSHRGVLRGMHYQVAPFAQVKLVRVIRGRLFDIVIDLRRSAVTFKRWFSIELSASSHTMLLIPEGFAHGFLALEDDTVCAYKTGPEYKRDSERGICWNDAQVGIDWQLQRHGIESPLLSDRDRELPLLSEINDAELF